MKVFHFFGVQDVWLFTHSERSLPFQNQSRKRMDTVTYRVTQSVCVCVCLCV